MFNKKDYMREYYKKYYQANKKSIQAKRIARLKVKYGKTLTKTDAVA